MFSRLMTDYRFTKPTPSGRMLAQLLAEDGEVARRIRASGIHRTQLWRFATLQRVPAAKAIAILSVVSDGLVAADGWTAEPNTTNEEAA